MLTKRHKQWIFIIFFALLFTLVVYLLKDYWAPIVFGALLSYFLYPIYTRIVKIVKYPVLAQIILSIGSGILITLFLIVLLFPLVGQAQILYQKAGPYVNSISTCPSPTCDLLEKFSLDTKIVESGQDFLQNATQFFITGFTQLLQGLFDLVIFIILVVFSLFYFLSHGKELYRTIFSLVPLDVRYKRHIFARLKETVRAVIGGNVISALLQGVIGGMIFFLAGVPLAVLWGFLMAMLAFIPAVGPTIIWVPASLILVAQGNITAALIVAIPSLIILGYIDNFLKPKLIGDKIQLSSFVIFLGVLGGINFFGILGIFFGPLILALFATCVQLYTELIKKKSPN